MVFNFQLRKLSVPEQSTDFETYVFRYHFSITNHDFLLAAMIICLDLMSVEVPECVMSPEQKLNAIRGSRAIWQAIVNDCRDAKRAVKVLTAVLEKLSKKFMYSTRSPLSVSQSRAPLPATFTPASQNQNVDSLRYNAYFTDSVGLGWPTSCEESPSNSDSLMQDNFLDAFSTDLTIPSDFDWVGEPWHNLVTVS